MRDEKVAGANGNKRNSNARRRVRKLSPREQLELKKKLRKKEKKSVIIKRAITAAFLTLSGGFQDAILTGAVARFLPMRRPVILFF